VLSNELPAIIRTDKFGFPVFHQQAVHHFQNIVLNLEARALFVIQRKNK